MPHSLRRSAAVRRAQYTGEASSAAALGIPRGAREMGLDRCTPQQRRLRVLLALGVFNQGLWQAWPGEWAIYGIIAYDIHLSPRHDHLALVCGTPYNAVCWLAPRGNVLAGGKKLPGLRLDSQVGGTYQLRHLPTGATMCVTPQRSTRPDPDDNHGIVNGGLWGTGTPLTEGERAALNDLPHVAPTAEHLLAGLFVRLCLRDPDDAWAVGTFFDDPLLREETRRLKSGERRLWGHGTHWELEWTSYPFVEDLVSALTDPSAGIPGAKALRVRRGWDIVLDDSVLALRPHR